MQRIALLFMLGATAVLTACQSNTPRKETFTVCTMRLEEAGRCTMDFGTTYTTGQY